MFRREREPLLTREDMNGIIELLMRLDENVKVIRQIAEGDDGEAEGHE
ncbi:MAG: hypothetical protein H0V45_08160 [Actinobacteria bacterium]|nr:hypothetical protein [Actinomycetota bacterium]